MFAKLSEYIDHELDEVTCREIETHARDCIKCKACLETLKKTTRLCSALPGQRIPRDFSERLKSLVKELI